MPGEPHARPGVQGALDREGAEGEDDVCEGVLCGEPADQVIEWLVMGTMGLPVGGEEVGEDLVIGVLKKDGEENSGKEEYEIPRINSLLN